MNAIPGALAVDQAHLAEPRFLGRQTAGLLIRNIAAMYRRHLGVLMACTVLPMLPVYLPVMWLDEAGGPLYLLAFIVYMAAAFVVSSAATIVISDICIGNHPSALQAFRQALGRQRWWQVLWTSLLLTLGVMVGMLLLLPGLWLMARSFLTAMVVTLEGRSGMDAIKRSLALTKGQAWRVIGLTLLPMLLAFIPILVVVIAVSAVLAFTVEDPHSALPIIQIVSFVMAFALFAPVISITMVLLYYDQRVRREAYDVQALTEDLMR